MELEGQENIRTEDEDDLNMIRKDNFLQLADKFTDVGDFGYSFLYVFQIILKF